MYAPEMIEKAPKNAVWARDLDLHAWWVLDIIDELVKRQHNQSSSASEEFILWNPF
jgi:hypothetical protein